MERKIISILYFIDKKPRHKSGLDELDLKVCNGLLKSEYLEQTDGLLYITKKGRFFLESLIYDKELI